MAEKEKLVFENAAQFIEHIKKNEGKLFEVKVALSGGIHSTHVFSFDKTDGIYHMSFVDSSEENLTEEAFAKSLYGEAFDKKAIISVENIETE